MAPRVHPLNRAFHWAAPAGPHRLLDAQQARAWNEQGFFVLENAFAPDEMQAVIAEIDPIEAQVAAFLESRPDGKLFIAEAGNITFTTHLVLRSETLRAFCGHRTFQDLGHDLIGPDVRLYWDQAVYKHPERPGRFPWHQDNGYTYLEPQQYLTCWVALTDATRDNGCPWVAPGLHKQGTIEHWMTDAGWQCIEDPPDPVPAEAPAGSIVVFSSLTPHTTGPNTSNAVRKAYIVQFAPDRARVFRDGHPPELQNDAGRQFPILVGGERVEAAA